MKKILAILLTLVSTIGASQLKVSALPTATTLTGAELVPIVQNSTTVKTTASSISAISNSLNVPYTGATTSVNLGANNINTNNAVNGVQSITSVNGTTTLTLLSPHLLRLTGSASQTVQLPNATTLPLNISYELNNNSTGNLIVVNAGGTNQTTIPSGGVGLLSCQNNSTSNGTWEFHFLIPSNSSFGTSGLAVNGTLTTAGFTSFTSTGVPASGEPNDFNGYFSGSLTGNNYLVRSNLNYSTTANNNAYRVGALLGVVEMNAANTGTIGWSVGCYGVGYVRGTGVTTRNLGGYFIGSNKSTGAGSVIANYAVYAQTENETGYLENNHGLYIKAPAVTGGTVNTNFGAYIATQTTPSVNTSYALYTEGANDLSYFSGNVTVNNGFKANNSGTVTGVLTTTNISGGAALSQSLVLSAGTNTGSSGTGIAIQLQGGNASTVIALSTLHNGNLMIPNNRTIVGLDAGGSQQTLLNWSTGDNLTIQGKQGSTDITINPTSSSKGMTIKSQGRVGFYGTASPTGIIHIGTFGSVSASGAPLKFTVAGSTLMTTPEVGAIETSSVNGALYYTPTTSNRYQIGTVLTATAALNFTNTLAQTSSELTITVTGAAVNDAVAIGEPATVNANSSFSARVTAANTVTVKFNNYSALAIDPASATFKATVIKN